MSVWVRAHSLVCLMWRLCDIAANTYVTAGCYVDTCAISFSLRRHTARSAEFFNCEKHFFVNSNNNNIYYCNCVITRWQWLLYMYTNMEKKK